MHRLIVSTVAVLVLVSTVAFADIVVPADDVTTGVIVRESASAQSAIVDTLHPSEQAILLGSVPNWHHIQLANGKSGFVSKRWTRVISAAAPTTPATTTTTTPTFTIDVVDVGTGLGMLV